LFIYVIRNARRKMLFLLLSIILWTASFYLAKTLFEKYIMYSITINRFIEFSYPYSIKLDRLFFKNGLHLAVETTAPGPGPGFEEIENILSVDNYFSMKYPSWFEITPHEMGGEILYHIDFSDWDKTIHGFVQVWNLPQPLNKFLEDSARLAGSGMDNVEVKSISVDGVNGFLWSYKTSSGDNTSPFYAYEAFLKKGEIMYRLSFFVPADKWSKDKEDVFMKMLNSFRFRQ